MSDDVRSMVRSELECNDDARLTYVLELTGISSSSWYHRHAPPGERRRPGPRPSAVPQPIEDAVVTMAQTNPWYGYQRIAVMCRRSGVGVTNRQCYKVMKTHNLLQKRKARAAEAYQAARLFELMPTGPNQLWQMDVTYIHIPGHGWWYAVTVIDYFSRYLLAAHLTPSYSAMAATEALDVARREAERVHGPMTKPPFLVTDNGSTFIARRFIEHIKDDFRQVRIAYRTPTQLGLLERFHRTLKEEEVYWRLYESPAHARECLLEFRDRYNNTRPHWALVPEAGGDPVTPAEVYQGTIKTQIPRWQGWALAAREKLNQMLEPAA